MLWTSDTARHVTESVWPYNGCEDNLGQRFCVCANTLWVLLLLNFEHKRTNWPVWASCEWLCPCWPLRPTRTPQCWFLQWQWWSGWERRRTTSPPSHTNIHTPQRSGDEHTVVDHYNTVIMYECRSRNWMVIKTLFLNAVNGLYIIFFLHFYLFLSYCFHSILQHCIYEKCCKPCKGCKKQKPRYHRDFLQCVHRQAK